MSVSAQIALHAVQFVFRICVRVATPECFNIEPFKAFFIYVVDIAGDEFVKLMTSDTNRVQIFERQIAKKINQTIGIQVDHFFCLSGIDKFTFAVSSWSFGCCWRLRFGWNSDAFPHGGTANGTWLNRGFTINASFYAMQQTNCLQQQQQKKNKRLKVNLIENQYSNKSLQAKIPYSPVE